MKALVERMARLLVDNPDQVEVQEKASEQTTVYLLRVGGSDLGQVIGRQGRTARAMRALLHAAGEKARRRFVLDIEE